MHSRNKSIDSPMGYSEKRVSQWENLMRKFSRAHEEECRQVVMKMPLECRRTKYFPTGSQYDGTWDVLGMSGYGVYTYNSGVIYEGDFQDGMFHGYGQFRFPNGTVIRGHFEKGVMQDRELIFPDGLVYEEEDWGYCKMPDRRYTIEYIEGIQPAGRSNITAEMPPRVIPPGFYDTGDGYYSPESKSVYKVDDLDVIIRSPSEEEQLWIINNCRFAPEKVMGPRMDLYEKWPEPELELPYVPKPAANVQPVTLTKRFASDRYHGHHKSQDHVLWDPNRSWVNSMDVESGTERKAYDRSSVDNARSSMTSFRHAQDKMRYHYNSSVLESNKLSTGHTKFSDVINKNVDVSLATVVQKAKDAVFKYSDLYKSRPLNIDTDTTITKHKTKSPDTKTRMDVDTENIVGVPRLSSIKKYSAIAFSDTEEPDRMDSNNVSFDDGNTMTRLRSCNRSKPEYSGLTSSVLMFKTINTGKAKPNNENIRSTRTSSNSSEVQLNAWEDAHNKTG